MATPKGVFEAPIEPANITPQQIYEGAQNRQFVRKILYWDNRTGAVFSGRSDEILEFFHESLKIRGDDVSFVSFLSDLAQKFSVSPGRQGFSMIAVSGHPHDGSPFVRLPDFAASGGAIALRSKVLGQVAIIGSGRDKLADWLREYEGDGSRMPAMHLVLPESQAYENLVGTTGALNGNLLFGSQADQRVSWGNYLQLSVYDRYGDSWTMPAPWLHICFLVDADSDCAIVDLADRLFLYRASTSGFDSIHVALLLDSISPSWAIRGERGVTFRRSFLERDFCIENPVDPGFKPEWRRLLGDMPICHVTISSIVFSNGSPLLIVHRTLMSHESGQVRVAFEDDCCTLFVAQALLQTLQSEMLSNPRIINR